MILGKKIGAAVLSFALVLSLLVLPAGAAGEIGVTIDGTSVLYDDGYGRPFFGQRRADPGALPADYGELWLCRLLEQ